MERLAEKLKDILNEQDFCFEPWEIKVVEKALGRLVAIEDILGDEYDLDELSKAMAALRRGQDGNNK